MTYESKVTAQNQTSVPAEIRRKMGIGPGARLTWSIDGERVVVSAKTNTLDQIHAITAKRKVKYATDAQIKAGIIAGATRGRR
jgi:AbrB family looped-hinge helix DNA binding protein